MKRFAILMLAVGCLILLAGCGHDSHRQVGSQHVSEPSDHDADGTLLPLKLDDGRKWQVDEHTRGSAAVMTELVRNAAPIASVDDARAFAGAINDELKNLIQGCTMEGPAHDELHVFLAALFPRIGELNEGTDPEKLLAVQQEVGSLFDAYEQHFE